MTKKLEKIKHLVGELLTVLEGEPVIIIVECSGRQTWGWRSTENLQTDLPLEAERGVWEAGKGEGENRDWAWFLFVFVCFKTGFLSVNVLAVLELTL